MNDSIRYPCVSGMFYSSDADELRKKIREYTSQTPAQIKQVKAIIAPHAGYEYCGNVAGQAYSYIKSTQYNRVILFGPSHRYPTTQIIYSDFAKWRTPLGDIAQADFENIKSLQNEQTMVSNLEHIDEHCLEVQLPFLQMMLTNFSIIPGLVGEIDVEYAADYLKERIKADDLIVVSTDLSHYHDEKIANSLDNTCTKAIIDLDTKKLEECEACGLYPVMLLCEIARQLQWKAELICYNTSGSITNDYDRVVGYASLIFTS